MIFSDGSISRILTDTLIQYAEFAFLMGSAETPRFNLQSDIDIAVYWKSSCNENQRNQLYRMLEEKFSREIDLISLERIDVIFARQVLETGRLLFTQSDGFLLNWKMEQLSDYPDFKASRKIIEDNILKRKKYV